MAISFADLEDIVRNHNGAHVAKPTPAAITGILRGKSCIARPSMGFGITPFHTVLDSATSTEGDLPVVICIGMNYGQIATAGIYTAMKPTGMSASLTNVLKAAASKLAETRCHLVATNFFPALSPAEWGTSAPTRVADVALFADAGFGDCLASVATLFSVIGPDSVAVAVFHGAHNSVPALGWVLKSRILLDFQRTEWIFCDNISSRPRRISNAIRVD